MDLLLNCKKKYFSGSPVEVGHQPRRQGLVKIRVKLMTPLFFVVGVLPITTGRSDNVCSTAATRAENKNPERRNRVIHPIQGSRQAGPYTGEAGALKPFCNVIAGSVTIVWVRMGVLADLSEVCFCPVQRE